MDEKFEMLRDKLRQAAVHSPSARTRWAAEACLDAPDALTMIRLTQSLSCSYAPALKRMVAEYWRVDA